MNIINFNIFICFDIFIKECLKCCDTKSSFGFNADFLLPLPYYAGEHLRVLPGVFSAAVFYKISYQLFAVGIEDYTVNRLELKRSIVDIYNFN